MTNQEALRLMQAIGQLATVVYPIEQGSDLDPRLVMSFGLIRGVVEEAIAAVKEDRKLRVIIARTETGET
jgi:hypothetical protein